MQRQVGASIKLCYAMDIKRVPPVARFNSGPLRHSVPQSTAVLGMYFSFSYSGGPHAQRSAMAAGDRRTPGRRT